MVTATDKAYKPQLGVQDMFRIGIGPSSSHTVGPMRAAKAFVTQLLEIGTGDVAHITVELYGSLAATGRGHYTDRATLLGLCGHDPQTVPTSQMKTVLKDVQETGYLTLPVLENGEIQPCRGKKIPFNIERDIHFMPGVVLNYHVNGMKLIALKTDATVLFSKVFYSVGGGFVMAEGEDGKVYSLDEQAKSKSLKPVPYPFSSGDELLEQCRKHELSIAQLVYENECANYTPEEVDSYLEKILDAMNECLAEGCSAEGILPGGLKVARRAKALFDQLAEREIGFEAEDNSIFEEQDTQLITSPVAELEEHSNQFENRARINNFEWAGTKIDPLRAMDWVNLYALAVNEENAAGHRVVTAPTNGAAGIIPAVLGYYKTFVPDADAQGCKRFLLTATAIGSIIKTNASIAGAEVGCQGEVGSASAMAAAGLAEVFGGTPLQVENAAEIAMEHNLGLTCDPVGGLVQIPCIERNAIAAVKAINAARMSLWSDGMHNVSLDVVIETMRQTGIDMLSKYKETSEGGLAVNVVEC